MANTSIHSAQSFPAAPNNPPGPPEQPPLLALRLHLASVCWNSKHDGETSLNNCSNLGKFSCHTYRYQRTYQPYLLAILVSMLKFSTVRQHCLSTYGRWCRRRVEGSIARGRKGGTKSNTSCEQTWALPLGISTCPTDLILADQ